jgi:antitoxin VapB
MDVAKLFKNGQSQAVRLPKEYRMEGNSVFVKHVGNSIVLIPCDSPWSSFKASLDKFTDDFMEKRSEPSIQIREDAFE